MLTGSTLEHIGQLNDQSMCKHSTVLYIPNYLAIDTQKEIKSGELSQVGKGRLN